MTLKELFERNDKNELYEIVSDYLHKPAEYRVKYSFEDYLEELAICPICEQINERDNMTWHKWDVGEFEDLICETCRNDEGL